VQAKGSNSPADGVNEKIATQGDKIRDLKASKADKAAIKAEVDVLLALKAEYKGITGTDWKPPGRGGDIRQEKGGKKNDASPASAAKQGPNPVQAKGSNNPADGVNKKIATQGDKIRDLKASKADKAAIKAEVDVLLALKAEYKGITGTDWKPPGSAGGGDNKQGKGGKHTPAANQGPVAVAYTGGGLSEAEKKEMETAAADALDLKIQQVGSLIRQLKDQKATKEAIGEEVKVLLFLKNCFKVKTGEEWQPVEKRGKENKKENMQLEASKELGEKSDTQLKREAKKLDKKSKKEQHRGGGAVGQETKEVEEADSGPDVSEGKYGKPVMNQSRVKLNRNLVDIGTLTPALNEKDVWVRARLHTSRAKGKQCFFVLRQQQRTVQGIAFVNESTSKQMIKFIAQ
jgi:bifunctional glutamyl/prolyl-tRNA synthetase